MPESPARRPRRTGKSRSTPVRNRIRTLAIIAMAALALAAQAVTALADGNAPPYPR